MKALSKKWIAAPLACIATLFIAACSGPQSLTLPALSQSQNKLEGQVIWRDLVTTNPEAVKPFYQNVFGWSFETVNNDYSLIRYQDQYIAGIATMPSNSSTNYWLPVISTQDVDSTLTQSEQAGGTTLIKKTTLKGRGDIAVIQDPQGAVFSVLNTVSGDPERLAKQSGNWMWEEVWSDNIVDSQTFYQQLSNYQSKTKTLGKQEYQYLAINDQPAFGFVKKPNSDVATTWVNYIRVDSIKATLQKVTDNGGIILMEPSKDIRNGTVAVIRDPAGAGFIVQEMK